MIVTFLKWLVFSPAGRAVLAAVALAGLAWLGYQYVYERGYHAAQLEAAANQAEAIAHALKQQRERDQVSGVVATESREALERDLHDTEERSHEVREVIRTVYRDRPVSAECTVPDGVRDALEAARCSANAAVRGLPASTCGAGAAGPD